MTEARQTAARLAAKIADTATARSTNYGEPEQNFANIADFWSAWLSARHKVEVTLEPFDVGVMSALMKVGRLATTPDHEDSALDAAAYLLLGYGCATETDAVVE